MLGAANRFPDQCSANPEAAKKLNVDASRVIAEAAGARDIFLIYISTDYVFSADLEKLHIAQAQQLLLRICMARPSLKERRQCCM